MRLQPGWRSLLSLSLISLQWSSPVYAKKDKPTISSSDFEFIPYNVNYFDDSDVLLFEDGIAHNIWRSTNAGESWDVVDYGKGKMLELVMHPFDKSRAYIMTDDLDHYKTTDKGKSWEKFSVPSPASIFREALNFHAGDHDKIIFNAMDCAGIFCEELTYYTTDGFSSDGKFLRDSTSGCYWAKSSNLFSTSEKERDNDRILCVAQGAFSPFRSDYRLVISDEFFKKEDSAIQEFEPELEPGRTVQGIVNLAVVKGYLIVASASPKTDEMALYVTQDTVKWHRAVFPHDHKLTEEAYTVLESTNYSIQIDVMTSNPARPMGVFFSSNSNGTYFSRNIEHTNRNRYGLVDFEKMANIQGIVMVNIVENWEEVEKKDVPKKLQSKISFDDGRTWDFLKTKDGKNLHLHSVDDLSNSGRVFSSPAPGLAMGVGNTGDSLGAYDDGNTWVSHDAGLTWTKALDGPYKYEFGGQGSILVAVQEGYGNEVKYSLDFGNKWHDVDLPDKVRAIQLTTASDSTSLKFLLEAISDKKNNPHGYIITLDFGGMHEKECKKDDMEKWYARVDEKGEPSCIMGHKQWYWRRQPDADCFVESNFEDPEAHFDKCECTKADFECDYNFLRNDDRTKCELAPGASVPLPEGECKGFGPDDTFKGPSGWRKIPGNECEKGEAFDEPQMIKCVDAVGHPASGKIVATQQKILGKRFDSKSYLERAGSSSGKDETVIMRTDKGVFRSENQGKDWENILKGEHILVVYPHPHFNDIVFFITNTKKVYYSTDRGKNIKHFSVPELAVDDARIMSFHPKNPDWIIWHGKRGCETSEGCHDVAFLTTDRGDGEWRTLQRYVSKCQFIKETETKYGIKLDEAEQEKRDKLIYCSKRKREANDPADNPWELVSSTNFFEEPGEVHMENVIDFATMSEFIVVATKDEKAQTLKVDTSVDGKSFADARFPPGFNVDHQQAYTVLDSSTHSVFLHVTVNAEPGLQYGSIIKSNSNGTFFTMSQEFVDRDNTGYVDFEKMFGVEGVAMVNIVANAEASNYAKEGKKLKTMITHNDGAQWDYLRPPQGGINDCKSKSIDKCSLNIHGYTERSDKSHTYSSPSAIGLMLGTGNVGEYLTDYKDANTYMTADGGITWKFAQKGTFMWEFGDQGSVVLIVPEKKATKVVYYTLNEGDDWTVFQFSDKEITIEDITTVPSDNSRMFLLWGYVGEEIYTINIDFSGLTDVQCKLDEKDVTGGDYDLWTPKHPNQLDDCLFGHVSKYHRKKKTSNCFNGRMIPHLHDATENCACVRKDYECDFNYERQRDGTCALVKGFTPPDHTVMCQLEGQIEYYVPTGYRKIAITTCDDTMPGAKAFDKSEPIVCPGKEDEFAKRHGLSGVGIFFAIVIPFCIAGGVGYWVWKNWANKFGQIRLGEQSSFDSEAPYIKYPVLVIAGLVAAVQATPLLISSLWRSARNTFGGRGTRFTTRDSFARGRGDYAVVDDDEGELLGEDSDEDAV